MVVPESAGRDRDRDKEEEIQVILLLAWLVLGVANGNVGYDEAVHRKSLEIEGCFLDRNKHSYVASEY
jgi:hypothetical protein